MEKVSPFLTLCEETFFLVTAAETAVMMTGRVGVGVHTRVLNLPIRPKRVMGRVMARTKAMIVFGPVNFGRFNASASVIRRADPPLKKLFARTFAFTSSLGTDCFVSLLCS